MDRSTPQQPEQLIVELPKEPVAQQQPTLPAWRTPTITRIDIKRTLDSAGSGNDGPVHTATAP